MHSHIIALVGWILSNAGALVAGGYLGYRFGDKVEAAVIGLYSKAEAGVRGVAGLVKK